MRDLDIIRLELKRLFAVFVGLVVGFLFIVQFVPGIASAGQVSTRSITLSDSTPAATGVTYAVTFTPATSVTHPDVIIDFCSNDPLVGDTCTATAGTDTPNFGSATASSGWTLSTIGSGRGVKLTTTTLSFTNGTPVTITLSNVTNPSNTATFYGRILTYLTGGAGTNTSASPGSYVDYGGTALSTASNITITSKVFETLTFCVYQSSCGTAPSLTLGDPTTGALSTSNAYVNSNAQYTLATNASNGVNVTMLGTTLCRSTGANCATGASQYTISSVGTTSTPPNTGTEAISTGTEQFGMCADKNSSTALTVNTTYNDTVNNCHGITTGIYTGTSLFGFNDTSSAGGTNSTGGSQVISSTGAVPSMSGSFTFMGDIAPTTEAGLYTTTLKMIATGTF